MNRAAKLVQKLAAGSFRELRERIAEALRRRQEAVHHWRQWELFDRARVSRIFERGFLDDHRTPDGDVDFACALRQKNPLRFFAGFHSGPQFRETTEHIDPRLREEILSRAQAVLDDRHAVFGMEGVSFGAPPQWDLNPVQGTTAPSGFYGSIPYLDGDALGDVKVPWELSRLPFVFELGQAYQMTGDEAYARKCLDLIADWSLSNRDYDGIHFCSALEFAFRINALCWAVFFFRDAASLGRREADHIYRLIYVGVCFIRRHWSTWFSPNTHLAGEAYAVYVAGLLFPEFNDAAEWEAEGLATLTTELERQVDRDGMHAEGAVAYHAYMLEFVVSTVLLSRANDRALPPAFDSTLADMTHALHALQRPDGRWPHIGDEDGGRLNWLSRPEAGDYRPLLELCRGLVSPSDTTPNAAYVDSFWLAGRGVGGDPDLKAKDSSVPPRPAWGLQAGFSVTRSLPGGRFGIMQCGLFGHRDCPHSHADMLHIDLSVGHDNFIVDPGTYAYTADPDLRSHYRSLAAHNGPNVPGTELHDPNDPFGWRQKPDVSVLETGGGGGMVYTSAGYTLDTEAQGPCRIVRTVLFVEDAFWVFRDTVSGTQPLPATWCFTSPLQLDAAGGGAYIEGRSGGFWLAARARDNRSPTLRIDDARISDEYLSMQDARAAIFTGVDATEHDLFWLALPLAHAARLPVDLERHEEDDGPVLSFSMDGEARTIQFRTRPPRSAPEGRTLATYRRLPAGADSALETSVESHGDPKGRG